MKAYELLFFVAPSTGDDIRKNTLDRIENTIKDASGSVDNIDEWGTRKLAYEINDMAEGYYILVDFHADPQSITELNRVLRINDAVVRHMIVARSDKQ